VGVQPDRRDNTNSLRKTHCQAVRESCHLFLLEQIKLATPKAGTPPPAALATMPAPEGEKQAVAIKVPSKDPKKKDEKKEGLPDKEEQPQVRSDLCCIRSLSPCTATTAMITG
jgi:hypothetical protein